MKEFICVCETNSFTVSPDTRVIKCNFCSQKYKISPGPAWVKIEPKPLLTYLFGSQEAKQELTEAIVESVSDFKKRLGIKKEKFKRSFFGDKKFAVKSETDFVNELFLEKKMVCERWKKYLELIQKYGYVVFEKNEHFGKLRGRHIAKAFHRDLKILGICSSLSFNGSGAIVKKVLE